MNKMNCFLTELCEEKIINPMYGDFKLQVFPVESNKNILLPEGFKLWERQINRIMSFIPHQENAKTHYITIDSKFFSEDGFLRREGVHIDGNYCVDPDFQIVCWSGSTWSGSTIENGKVIQKFASPYNIEMPIGKYVSESHGGILCASSLTGCDAWTGSIENDVQDGGQYKEEHLLHANKITLQANKLYFMTSNTPHETTIIRKGSRRTLIRVTLNHNYENNVFQNKASYVHNQSR
jgi:hypothetical protein